MKLELFHSIGNSKDTESAEVRKFIADNGLKDVVDFRNVSYDEAARDLFEYSAGHDTPVLVVDGKVLRGRALIIDWLKTNVLSLRD